LAQFPASPVADILRAPISAAGRGRRRSVTGDGMSAATKATGMAIAVHLIQTPMVILFMSDRCAMLES
jgi:hypothetical protein